MLEEKGYQVVSLHKAKDTIPRLTDEGVSLLIVDFGLDHSKGLELIDQAADLAPALPTILLVDRIQELSADLTDCRADVVLPKLGDELDQLIRSAEKLLRRRGPRKRPAAISKPAPVRKLG